MNKMLILWVVFSTLLFSCTTIEYSNVKIEDENIIYSNDFSNNLDDFTFKKENNEVIEIEDGTLHLDAYGKDKSRILVELNEKFPNSSIVTFRIKLFRGRSTGNGYAPRRATLFFWGSYPDNEGQIMFHPDSISFNQKQDGERLISESYSTRIDAHTWYEVIIVFENDKVTVFKDGEAKKSFNLVTPQKETNNLNFYTNKEYWIDDLEIHTYGSYQYIEPE